MDYLLSPNVLNAESDECSTCIAHFCPWNQTLPYVLQTAPKLEDHKHKFLVPTLHFQLGREVVKKGLAESVRKLGVSRKASDAAADAAYGAQREFQSRLIEAGKRALAKLDDTGEPGLILVGRGYNIYDRNINCGICGTAGGACSGTCTSGSCSGNCG